MLNPITLALAALTALVLFFIPPIHQDPNYHAFHGPQGPWSGIVWSNLPFALAGLAGLYHWLKADWKPYSDKAPWLLICLSGPLIAAGSAWYHLNPNNAALVWDRLPMTLAFMPLLAALFAPNLTIPLTIAGAATVIYWQQSGDLRPYVMAQFFPMLVIPLKLLSRTLPYTQTHRLWQMIGLYVLAKVAEHFDEALLAVTNLSGHTWKHCLAALALYLPLRMLSERQPKTETAPLAATMRIIDP